MHPACLDPLIHSFIEHAVCCGDDHSWSDQTTRADAPLCCNSDVDPPYRGPGPLVRPNWNALTGIKQPGTRFVEPVNDLCPRRAAVEDRCTSADHGEHEKSFAQRPDLDSVRPRTVQHDAIPLPLVWARSPLFTEAAGGRATRICAPNVCPAAFSGRPSRMICRKPGRAGIIRGDVGWIANDGIAVIVARRGGLARHMLAELHDIGGVDVTLMIRRRPRRTLGRREPHPRPTLTQPQ